MKLRVSALTRSHDRSGFNCSDETVDRFLKQSSLQDQKLDLSRTYVLTDGETDATTVIGYFTITPIHITQDVIHNDKPRIKREIPALLLGQLGVDVRFQKRGFGEILLLNAESKALIASEIIGLRAIILDARSESLARWYSGYGYSRVGSALRMAKTIEAIRRERASEFEG